MNLPFEKLTRLTCSNQLSGVFERCWLVETMLKGFPDQRSMRCIGPIDSFVDVVEQTNALGLGDTFEKNPITAPFIEDTVNHCIEHGFTAGSFHICTINQSILVCEVHPDWIHLVLPISNYSGSMSRIAQRRLPKEFTEYCLVA